jgi:hypothetical protein
MSKILVGSSLLQLDNCRDINKIEVMGHHYNIIKQFKLGAISTRDFYAAWGLFQLSNGFHDELDYPFADFDIFNYKEIWIKCLVTYFKSLNITKIAQQYVLPKYYYQYLYQYYMIKENQHYISAEAKAEVQKIHDLEVPGSYIYRIKELIDSL